VNVGIGQVEQDEWKREKKNFSEQYKSEPESPSKRKQFRSLKAKKKRYVTWFSSSVIWLSADLVELNIVWMDQHVH
jgi:hypothetical protein